MYEAWAESLPQADGIARRWAWRYRKQHLLDDVRSIARIAVWRLAGRYDGRIPWEAFLNVCVPRAIVAAMIAERELRSVAGFCLKTEPLGDLAPACEPTVEPVDVPLALEMAGKVDALPPRLQVVIAYRYWHGMSNAEVADVFRLSEESIRADAKKALKMMRG